MTTHDRTPAAHIAGLRLRLVEERMRYEAAQKRIAREGHGVVRAGSDAAYARVSCGRRRS